ncbi:MAG: hypothetical protein KDI83_02450 [Gammaproteobacteria bacterium]|nr:hypothetical protein [Gammaproteobacteria bacterium]
MARSTPGVLLGILSRAASATVQPDGGGACVVAKKLSDSLAIEWVVGIASVSDAIEQATSVLQSRGFDHLFSQASSTTERGWRVVLEAHYKTHGGKLRTSNGCGFNDASAETAEALAVSDPRSYSWGWKREYVNEKVAVKGY